MQVQEGRIGKEKDEKVLIEEMGKREKDRRGKTIHGYGTVLLVTSYSLLFESLAVMSLPSLLLYFFLLINSYQPK